jgi:hypothetical protein
MDSYASEALFLSSLPDSERFSDLKSLMDHCALIKSDREHIFTLAQGLLAHVSDFYQDADWPQVVKKCVETLRRVPDDSYGNIGGYARHVEKYCLA